jgi:Arylsulfotransferase (ASST)
MFLVLAWLCAAISIQPARGDLDAVSTDYSAYNDGKLGHHPRVEYQSSSEFSPMLQVNVWNQDGIDDRGSHIFLRHDGKELSKLSSPLVLDARDLSAVYMNRSFQNVFGTRVQENYGKKYLTFWEGAKGDGVGNGFGLAYDDTYKLRYNVTAHGIAAHADLHEFALTGHGTALVTGVDKVVVDMSKWVGWKGSSKYQVLDALFQEIDLETNELLFSWRALDHVNPVDSFEPRAGNWDIYHMNSVEKVNQSTQR